VLIAIRRNFPNKLPLLDLRKSAQSAANLLLNFGSLGNYGDYGNSPIRAIRGERFFVSAVTCHLSCTLWPVAYCLNLLHFSVTSRKSGASL
jgi:hypothetical protein